MLQTERLLNRPIAASDWTIHPKFYGALSSILAGVFTFSDCVYKDGVCAGRQWAGVIPALVALVGFLLVPQRPRDLPGQSR